MGNRIVNLCDNWWPWIIENDKKEYYGDKVQLGSYSCNQYFWMLIKYMRENKIPFTDFNIVLPVFPEGDLRYMSDTGYIDVLNQAKTLVVNDFGMLEKFRYKPIRLGRLFCKDYRDKRYPEYDDGEQIPHIDSMLNALGNMGYIINEIELDVISKHVNFIGLNDVAIYVHYPYRQITCSHICEFASIEKKIKEKFKPDDKCQFGCRKVIVQMENPEYIKQGRNVYSKIDETYLVGIIGKYSTAFSKFLCK